MSSPVMVGNDASRRAALRRMRAVALSLLILAALVYAATLDRSGGWVWVNAATEAAMVGAIADWFAVTALFRHPLGLPIPHTALVPKRKDMLGQGLEAFVGENFLSEQVIRDRVVASQVSLRAGEWLATPAPARWLVDEASEVVAIGLTKVRDEHVADLVNEALLPRMRDEPLAPIGGTLLTEILRDGTHHAVVDLALEELHSWMLTHHDVFTSVLGERAPWWSPQVVNHAVTNRAHIEIVEWLAEIRRDPRHQARAALDSMLAQLAHDLLTNPQVQGQAEEFKNRLLEHPQVAQTTVSLWNSLRRALVGSLEDVDGAVRAKAQIEVEAFAERLRSDADLRERLDQVAADAAVFAVDRWGAELTGVITHTIHRWDGKEASAKIELHVGRDLQFIRINGTIVGGLVGLLIHALSQVI